MKKKKSEKVVVTASPEYAWYVKTKKGIAIKHPFKTRREAKAALAKGSRGRSHRFPKESSVVKVQLSEVLGYL